MTLRERIGLRLLGIRAADLGQNPALIVPSLQVGRPVWNAWSVEKAIAEGLRAHDVVYSCTRRLYTDAASVPWRMMISGRGGPQESPTHRGAKIIARPNPRFSWQDMIELLTLDLYLGGNAYWLHLNAGQSDELWRLRPDRITIIPAKGKVISAYRYAIGEETHDLAPEQITHFRFFDPGDDYYGISPLRAAARVVDTDNEAWDWNKASLQNRATPAGALIVKGSPTLQQKEAIKKDLMEEAAGPSNARRPLVVGGADMDWKPFGMTPQEMDFIEGLKFNARRICNAFGVPITLTGLVDVTFENWEQSRRMFWEDTIIPFLYDQRDALNLQLAPTLGNDGAYFDVDLSQTPAVREAQRARADEATKYFAMGFSPRAINDHLGLGFDPADCPNTGFISAMLLPVSTPAIPEVGGPARCRSVNLQSEEQRATYWRAFDRQRAAFERAMGTQVEAEFRREGEELAAACGDALPDFRLLLDQRRAGWAELLLTFWRTVIAHFGQRTAQALGMVTERSARAEADAMWDAWPAWAQQFAEEQVAIHVVEISEATKEMIRQVVAEALAAGEGSPEVARRIRDLYAEFSTTRAYRIARTECGSAANYGSRMAAEESGVVRTHTWISSRDDRVRDSHAAIDGETKPFGERYSNGGLYPNDPSLPPEELINCRCAEQFGTEVEGELG